MNVEPLIRTIDQELLALERGASLECLVCGEFVLHRGGIVACPECEAELTNEVQGELQLTLQAG